MSESLNHSFNQFIQTHWLIQEQNNWLSFEWIIESFIQPIHSNALIQEQNNWLSLWVNHWIIHSTNLLKTLIDLRTKQMTLIHRFIQMIHSRTLIDSRSLWVNHWIIHSTNLFKTSRSETTDSFWVTYWLIHKIICSETRIDSGTKQLTVFMSESLNHSFNRFVQNTDGFQNKTDDSDS